MSNDLALLQPLLDIREKREMSRRRELSQSREQLNQRIQEMGDAKLAVQNFIQHRIREENSQFDALAGKEQQPKSLHYYRHNVEKLKQQQIKLQNHIGTCETRINEAADAVERAKEAQKAAAREVEKFKELVSETKLKLVREEQYKEDAELDEVSLSAWAQNRRS